MSHPPLLARCGARVGICALLVAACVETPVVPDEQRPAEEILCRYFLNPYFLPNGSLRFGPGEPVFADVKNATEAGTEIIVPYGPADQGARVSFTSGWITFHGIYAPEAGVEVKLLKPLRMSPVLTWNPGGLVVWLGSDEQKRMRVAAKPPDRFEPQEPLRASVECADTTIGFPRSADESGAESATPVELIGEAPVSVSATPGGRQEGILTLEKDESLDAERIDAKDNWVRIKVDLYPGTLDGWVAKERVRPPKKSDANNIFGMGGLVGGLAGSGKGRGTPRYTRCTQPADLHVFIEGQPPRKVGELRKYAAVVVGAHRTGFVEVTLPEDDWVHLEPNFHWVILDSDLIQCALSQAE
jgi:hypothetical protein